MHFSAPLRLCEKTDRSLVSRGDGRFINRDPIGEAGGLNLYAFAGNDGINGWDVLGAYPEREAPSAGRFSRNNGNDRKPDAVPELIAEGRLELPPFVRSIDWMFFDPDLYRDQFGFAWNWGPTASLQARLVESSIRVGVPALGAGAGVGGYYLGSELREFATSNGSP